MVFTKSNLVLLAALTLQLSATGGQDAKSYKQITVDRLEAILKGLDIDFKKAPSPTDKNLIIFTFERKRYKLALHDYGGKDLMLVADFPALPLELVNQWNRGARISRAVFYQYKLDDYTELQANLDLGGGVTDDTIRHFIRRYEDEVKKFDHFLFRNAVREEEVVTKVTGDRLEKVLKGMGLQFKKVSGKDEGVVTYEFERDTFKVRLHNFKGDDLMLDAAFKEIPLVDINKFNVARKFIRVVQVQRDKGKKYTLLETNLDCQGGVSDSVIRYFIVSFDEALRDFAKFIAR